MAGDLYFVGHAGGAGVAGKGMMLTATEIKGGIDKAVKKYANDAPPASGVIASLFGRVLVGQTKGGVDAIRHVVCAYLVGEISTKRMSAGQLCALSRWLTGKPDAFFGAELRDGIAGEMQRVYDAAMAEQGQVELIPPTCVECDWLDVEYEVARYEAEIKIENFGGLTSDDALYAARDDALNKLYDHRKTCAVFQAAHPKKTEAERLRELGY